MNRKLHLIFLILFVLLSVVACSSENGAAEIAQENTPPPTNTPQPTDTAVPPTHTPVPTATATATPIPTPTVEVCNIVTLEDAINSLAKLNSYQTNIVMSSDIEEIQGETMIEGEMAVQLQDGVVDKLSFTMGSPLGFSETIEMIFAEDRLYIRAGVNESWETVEGEVATNLLQTFTEAQLIRPEIINNLDISSCQVLYDTMDGVDAKIYSFGEFSLEGVETMSSSLINADPENVMGKSIAFTLLPFDDLLVPVKMEMVMQFFNFDEIFELTAVQDIHSVNEPVEIDVPAALPTSFILNVPLEKDATIAIERRDLITFSISGELQDSLATYQALVIENGWLEVDAYEQEAQGILFQTVKFTKGYDTLILLVGEQSGNVIITMLVEGLERFLDVPILPDSETQDEFGSYLEYLSPLSHDEILAFYEEIMPQEGWSLKNWGREVWEAYELTYRRYERGDMSIRITISEREEGTLVTIARE